MYVELNLYSCHDFENLIFSPDYAALTLIFYLKECIHQNTHIYQHRGTGLPI